MVLSFLLRNKVNQLPDNCQIYTTLEPCHMCSCFITDVGKDVEVFMGMRDPALLSPKNTTLDKKQNGCRQSLLSNVLLLPNLALTHKDEIGVNLGKAMDQKLDEGKKSAIDFMTTKEGLASIAKAAGQWKKSDLKLEVEAQCEELFDIVKLMTLPDSQGVAFFKPI
jgi:hypothetical protein